MHICGIYLYIPLLKIKSYMLDHINQLPVPGFRELMFSVYLYLEKKNNHTLINQRSVPGKQEKS